MLKVQTSGIGPDIALIHGWGLHSGIWEPVAAALAARFRVHCIDLPGHGASAALTDNSWDGWVAALAEAVPEGATVVAWSLGAQVAMALAAGDATPVRRLVLVSATPCFVQRPGWPCAMAPAVLDGFAASLAEDWEATLRRFLALQARGGDAAREVLATLRPKLFERGRPSVPALESGLRFLRENDLRGVVHGVAQRTLLIHGTHDTLSHPDAARWLAANIPGARLSMLEHAGHAPFLSHPAEFLAALEPFLDE